MDNSRSIRIIRAELETLYYNNYPELHCLCMLGTYTLLICGVSLYFIWFL